MPITTPRMILRPPQPGDETVIHAAIIESFDSLNQYMPWAKEKQSIETTEIFVRQAAANWILKKNEEPYLPILIFDRTTMQFIGSTGYHHIDWTIPSLEMGYWLRDSRTSQGLMTEAVNALTQYAFKQLQVKRITITCDIRNDKSRKIPERLGFCLEGTLKFNRLTIEGELSNTLIFARYNLDGLPALEVTW